MTNAEADPLRAGGGRTAFGIGNDHDDTSQLRVPSLRPALCASACGVAGVTKRSHEKCVLEGYVCANDGGVLRHLTLVTITMVKAWFAAQPVMPSTV